MRRIAAKIAYFAAALVMLFTAGCKIADKPDVHIRVPKRSPEPIIEIDPQASVRHSLSIITKLVVQNGCRIHFPYVCNPDMDLLNMALQSAFTEFASECEAEGGEVDYTIEFNRFGLLSFILNYVSDDGSLLYTDTANYDTDTGKRVSLFECFGTGKDDPTDRLNELVGRRIAEKGYTVLGEVPSVSDDTLFVFAFGGLDICFRPYEAFSYDAGSPRLRISIYETSGYIADDGLLNRLR